MKLSIEERQKARIEAKKTCKYDCLLLGIAFLKFKVEFWRAVPVIHNFIDFNKLNQKLKDLEEIRDNPEKLFFPEENL
ncbi:MAG: hypothetical protein KKH94_11455 [Candidatus Omnitrophica bacterium]|nr:hypothetical protein [Candidatus Omnitrophota bacterium]